jgi:hypothetical protein
MSGIGYEIPKAPKRVRNSLVRYKVPKNFCTSVMSVVIL